MTPSLVSVALLAAFLGFPPGLSLAQIPDQAAPVIEIDPPAETPKGLRGGSGAHSLFEGGSRTDAAPDNPYAPPAAADRSRAGGGGLFDPYAPAAPAGDPPLIEAPGAAASNFLAAGMSSPRVGMPVQSGPPVVVELFTSEGCSSCPAADAMHGELAGRPGVLALSYHVDYWDYLGWADSFAKPQFTERQKNYARAAGERAVFTPQIIVGGEDTALSLGPAELTALINANRLGPALVTVAHTDEADSRRFELQPQSDLGGKAVVLLVRYVPERTVEITKGENRGRTLTYRNVVLSVEELARWDGRGALRMNVSDGAQGGFPDDTRHAILIQRLDARSGMPGAILTAIQLD